MMLCVVVEELAMTKTLLAFVLSASLLGCRGEAEVRYSGAAAAPELVVMDTDPSVMVVANADEPIFYVENTYWLYRDNHWFRSSSHRSGWKRVESPPDHIRRIDRPLAYVHFRPSATQRTTFNQRDQVEPQRSDIPEATERTRPIDPSQTQPYANPPPPQQVPPSPDSDPTLRGPTPTRPMPPDQVPSAPSDRDRPDRQIAPDPDRAPTSPNMQNQKAPNDQRPAADRSTKGKAKDKDQGDRSKRRPDPDKDQRDSDDKRPEDKN